MNKLTKEKRIQVIVSLVEGNSIRATCRMADVAKGTVLKLLMKSGLSATPKERMSLKRKRVSLALAMFGLGQRFVPILNLCLRGI